MEYAEKMKKGTVRSKKKSSYTVPGINRHQDIIQRMRLNATVSKNTQLLREDSTVIPISYGDSIKVDTDTPQRILGKIFYKCRLDGTDEDFYIREDCVDLPSPEFNRSQIIVRDVIDKTPDSAVMADGKRAMERKNRDCQMQAMGNTFELYAKPYLEMLHKGCLVLPGYRNADNELDFVVFDHIHGQIIIYSAKLNPKKFDRGRDREMWEQLKEKIFQELGMVIGPPALYGEFFRNPIVRLITPETFGMTRAEFWQKFE